MLFSGPRGEIVVGGPLVANGYYNLPEKTTESFYEEDGTKWFRTGDIRRQGGNSQNFLRKFVRFFVTLGLKILRL